MREKPLNKHSLDSSDVFILDLGLEIYQWNGKTCNKDEKFRAVQFLQTLKVRGTRVNQWFVPMGVACAPVV